jgi:hypothetical protein
MQMEACAPRYALVFGAVATSALLPFPVTLSSIRGRWWKLTTGQWAMATMHPAQFLYRDSPNGEGLLRTDIASFTESVRLADLHPPMKSEECLLCFRWAEGFIQEVGFCSKHYPKKLKKVDKDEQMSLFQGLQ